MYTLDLIRCHPHQFLKIRSVSHSFLSLQSNSQKLHVLSDMCPNCRDKVNTIVHGLA